MSEQRFTPSEVKIIEMLASIQVAQKFSGLSASLLTPGIWLDDKPSDAGFLQPVLQTLGRSWATLTSNEDPVEDTVGRIRAHSNHNEVPARKPVT